MAFIIKKEIKKELNRQHQEATQEFTHEPTGIVITFRSSANQGFQRAFQVIVGKHRDMVLTAQTIANFDGDELTADEAFNYAIGEHLIADWNVMNDTDGNTEKLPITGENFAILLSNLDYPEAFTEWCLECAKTIAENIKKQVQDTVKKPSKGGNGNKTTKT